ncbi:BNR/Asp-box repeat protein [Colletotrichum navitas]|uniref:BNR/Asp-box repeat protein n=1 Tax=Colletotrichum navitas TaxID=681940 RepID=A0AAD8PN86_9PEZI|nr:BNR/Asp-box repeat protein [Colletotrichum navitas]KAK1573301.1 BNR/Asp-box repeat protein [Colletotrichum navitas]
MIIRSALIAAVGALTCGIASGLETFERNLIFQPPDNYTDPRVLYPRTVQLIDGRLLATWENYSPEPPLVWFPIYESLDGGLTWEEVGQVHDQVNNWGLRYQPFLYELRQDFAGFPVGTILLAGNSIPTDLSETQIDLYASRDKGRTWEFLSHVARGGRAIPNNEETPVWEPFILIFEDDLILYYADQRSSEHGQEISHQTTKDLKNWSDVVIDVTYPRYTDRPGMPFITQLANGDYMYTFEYGGADIITPYSFPIYYRIAKDPRKFADAPDHYIKSTNGGVFPINSPNVVWSPVGGCNGTIIVSSNTAPLFINRRGGEPDAWVAYDSPEPGAYTRNVRVFEEDPDYLIIMGAGVLPPSTTNKVTVSVLKLSNLLGLKQA